MLTNHLRQIEAIDIGHADIGQHDRDILLQKMLQRLGCGSGLDQVFAKIAQDDFVAEELRRLIVDHENVYLLIGVHRRGMVLVRHGF